MNIVFSEQAQEQLRTIQEEFRQISLRLAASFAAEVRNALWRLERFPLSGQSVSNERRVILRRFRYLMLYEISERQITITKLVHQKRDRPV